MAIRKFFHILITLFIIIIFFTLIINDNMVVSFRNNKNKTQQVCNNQTRSTQSEGWSSDVRISDKNNDYWCGSPRIVVKESYVHTIWDENLDLSNNPGHGLCYRRSINGGNSWDNIIYLTEPYDSTSNDIIVENSNIHVAFTSKDINSSGICYLRSLNNGTTWEPINSNLTDIGGTSLNIDGSKSNVHISFAYRDEEKKIWSIIYLHSIDNGETWKKSQFLVNGTGITNFLRPRLKVYLNNIYIVYWGLNDTIELLKSSDNGETWKHDMISSGPNVAFPDIAVKDNHVGIAWINLSDSEHPQLEFLYSNDYGMKWSQSKLINDQEEYLWVGLMPISIELENNIFYIVWTDSRDWPNESNKPFTEIYFKKSIDFGKTWYSDKRLTKKTKPESSSWEPSISVEKNSVYVIWLDERIDRMQPFVKRTLPDYYIQNISKNTTKEVWANTTIKMDLLLTNIGFADGYFINVTVRYLDEIIFEGLIENINLREIKTISFPWVPLNNGVNTLTAIIDFDKKNQEWDENNNVFEKDFFVQENSAPIAKLKVNQTRTEIFKNIEFDASKSYDPDGLVKAYYFDFGDGNTSDWITKPIITYNYSQAGKYTCTAKVRDDRDGENLIVCEQEIMINWPPLPPTINNVTIYPLKPYCKENVTIVVNASDLNLDTLEYIYAPKNGTVSGTGANVTWRAPRKPGIYEISVQVFDGKFYSDTYALYITVRENQPPVIQNINLSSSKVALGDSVNITINASDPDGHTIQYSYHSTGGKIIENGTTITWFAPDLPGIHIITINVTDGHDGFDKSEIFIVAGEPKPSSLIKSFKVNPNKIYKAEPTKILLELEIDKKYINFIDRVTINSSMITGKPIRELFDDGLNSDAEKSDGIYSYKFNIIIDNFTGEYQLWGTVFTTIPGFELNASTTLSIEEKPGESGQVEMDLYINSIIILIIIFIVIIFLWSKFKHRKK